jgi:hypothetical protein
LSRDQEIRQIDDWVNRQVMHNAIEGYHGMRRHPGTGQPFGSDVA